MVNDPVERQRVISVFFSVPHSSLPRGTPGYRRHGRDFGTQTPVGRDRPAGNDVSVSDTDAQSPVDDFRPCTGSPYVVSPPSDRFLTESRYCFLLFDFSNVNYG